MTLLTPDYAGSGLVNLMAEIEIHLTGRAPRPGLSADLLPEREGYVLVVFDGLGAHQLDHPAAAPLAEALRASLSAGFPTTTTTSMATIVTGLEPAAHGLIGHHLRLPGVSEAVNVLKWVTPSGKPVDYDYASVLPAPNLWERLKTAGIEPITVQPGTFIDTPLSRLLYRGCRFEPAWTVDELVRATLDVAGPGRFVLVYYPEVDVAAHIRGQESDAYRDALAAAATIWERLANGLGANVGLAGTADHGHIDYASTHKELIRNRRFDPLEFSGDPRSVYASGPNDLIDELAETTGAESRTTNELLALLGTGSRHPSLDERLPHRLLLAPPGRVLLPRGFDKRLVGYHGGLEEREMLVPFLIRP